jgi:DNA mismatch repair protein MutS
VHLDAVEHKDRIVFLHRLESGPADRSYGLQVAALAGVPREVIRAARRHLGELESHMAPKSAQAGLFDAPAATPEPRDDRLAEALDGLDPDTMSPKQALEALYRLRKLRDEG